MSICTMGKKTPLIPTSNKEGNGKWAIINCFPSSTFNFTQKNIYQISKLTQMLALEPSYTTLYIKQNTSVYSAISNFKVKT